MALARITVALCISIAESERKRVVSRRMVVLRLDRLLKDSCLRPSYDLTATTRIHVHKRSVTSDEKTFSNMAIKHITENNQMCGFFLLA